MPNTVSPNPSDPTIAASDALYKRGIKVIPGATHTLAKGAGQYVRGVAPKFVQRGRGGRVWDVDGNEYLDMTMGVGPIVLGYAEPAVDAAIRAQLEDGISFSQTHPLEVEVAERVAALVPGAEMVRFGKNGCDVTTAAVRVARAFTGRSKVLCCGYHGWHDWYISVTDRNKGVPAAVADLTHTIAYNDLSSVEDALDDDTACVILEPVTFEEPRPGFLEGLKKLCEARGALLIFDEMWTGFRLALGGAQERFGVKADLACFSKAIANGMPLSALTGRADVMRLFERDVFFFSTFGGETLSLAAAMATMRELEARRVPEQLDKLGRTLRDGYNALVGELGIDFTKCVGYGCRTLVTFSPTGAAAGADPLVMKSFVQQELIRHGVLWSGFHNLCAAHDANDAAYILGAYRTILPALQEALKSGKLAESLRGEPVEPVFRRTTNFHVKPKQKANGNG
jgi:glutamate-1-semialdehyde aminotransferase